MSIQSSLFPDFEPKKNLDIPMKSSESIKKIETPNNIIVPELDITTHVPKSALSIEELLEGMNPEQKEAVLYDEGSLLVLAGAGSGKTRVITHRFAYLVKKHNLGIHNILCVTFTNKAAGEMKERIGHLLGMNSRTAWVRTFHSMCAMMLREHAEHIGFSKDFTIYDTVDTRNTIKKIMERLNIDPKSYPDKAIARSISSAKEELISPEEFSKSARTDFDHVCLEVYKEYKQTLKQNQAMDFGDLIENTILLLETCPEIRERYQRQWHYVMADEFQDTNKPQYLLLSLLSRDKNNVCVVGDDDQSIYAWRGARVENIRQYHEEFHAHIIRLERNYRSYGNILEAANSVVQSIRGRMPKTLKAEREKGEKITLRTLGDDRLQAAFVYEEIEKLKQQGKSYRDFAILYRMNSQSRVIEEVLTRHQVPYKVYGGLRFFDRAEIKDILSYLRIIANPFDIEAFERVVNVPKRKIGDAGKKRIQEFAAVYQLTYPQACMRAEEINGLNKNTTQNLINLGKILEEIKEAVSTTPPTQLVKILVESIRYFEDYLVPEYGAHEAEDRFQNIQELVNAIRVFEELNPQATIADFLREASLLSSLGEEGNNNEDAISLMTIHSAKGLEFPVVFLIGVAEGVLPLSSSKTNEELDEEKRLFYVAVTRAMDKLYLTYEKRTMRYGEFMSNEGSHFLDSIPRTVLDIKYESSDSNFNRDNYRGVKSSAKKYSGSDSYYQKSKGRQEKTTKSPSISEVLSTTPISSNSIKTEKFISTDEIHIGTQVAHSVFGKGEVEYVSKAMVRVSFEQFGTQVIMGNALTSLKKIIN